MAPPPFVALRRIRLAFADRVLLDDAALALGPGDRMALVGRNGSGKSTLMKLVAGEIEPDAGERIVLPSARIAVLPQDPVFAPGERVIDHAMGDAADRDAALHEGEAILDRLDLAPDRLCEELSGGERRRASLARALLGQPDVLLLDEPTNHLDLPTIERLEGILAGWRGAVLVVSHDRAFLDAVANGILWLDRGKLRETRRPFRVFDEWAEEVRAEEARLAERLDTRLAQELHWLARGVTARRKRNQGRLARLEVLRDQRSSLLGAPRKADVRIAEGEVRSRMAIEADRIAKSFPATDGEAERAILAPFSTRILRGDRVGIVGPNGAGKTTLVRMLAGELAPDQGEVRLAPGLTPTYYDQRRAALDPTATPWDVLCPEGGDVVTVGGESRHVMGYLKDWLFAPEQARTPVSVLSGGERSRLLLARLFSRPTDLLVLDEPTNDLDMDTLDLLEDLLGDYAGTLLVVSHDRDFLDRVATSIIAMEGDGQAREYVGGWSDYVRQRPPREDASARRPKAARTAPKPRAPASRSRLSFKEAHELERLPALIEALTREVANLRAALADPALYSRDAAAFADRAAQLEAAEAQLGEAEERWLVLEEKREAIEAGRTT